MGFESGSVKGQALASMCTTTGTQGCLGWDLKAERGFDPRPSELPGKGAAWWLKWEQRTGEGVWGQRAEPLELLPT